MVTVFADMTEVMRSPFTRDELYVRIGGEVVNATEAHTSHDVDQPIGTCRVMLPLPRPESLVIGADIEIEMGYPGLVRRVFHGYIPDDDGSIDETDAIVTVNGIGWGAFLADEDAFGMVFDGPVSLKEIYRGCCEARSVPTYLADDTTLPNGTTIMLGGNEQVDNGDVIIDDRTSPGAFLSRAAELFGYRIYDIPDGTNRLSRVSGLPSPRFEGGDLTTELVQDDYVRARTTINVRSGAGTSNDILGTIAGGAYGRVIGTELVIANGYPWAKIAVLNGVTGWCGLLATSTNTPNFYRVTPSQPIHWITEGVNAYRFEHQRSAREMRTYFDVKGARYTDVDGGPVEIRSIADEIPSASELRPLGYRIERFSDQILVTPQLAEGCRNCLEIDRSALYERHGWEQTGNPEMMPGQIAVVTSETLGIENALRWVMGVQHDFDSDGFFTTVEGWAGGGEALAAGNDCRTESVPGDSVIHVGNETLSHYRDPSPDSSKDADNRMVVTIPFTVTSADYSSLRLTGKCHGTNSLNNSTTITGSKIEVWQLQDPSRPESGTNEKRRVGTLELPTANEELSKRRDYGSSWRYWTDFSLPLPGSLKEGAAELVAVAGTSKSGEYDDYELADLKLTYCGVGIPNLPGSTEVA